MQTSKQGIEFLERHEEVVLRTYIDPVGVPTIGAGLTKASGVVVPKPGMTITRAEASALLGKALKNNYEPAVRKAMPHSLQHEFDGGVSFHWNTGAIGRASWVKAWRKKDWPDVKRRIKLWNKGGGRVLRGLSRRRSEEYGLIRTGYYGPSSKSVYRVGLARFVKPHTTDQIRDIRDAFSALGYAPGSDRSGVSSDVIRQFQRDHALTADAIVGRATLSTLQRMLDARKKAKDVAVSTTGGAGGVSVGGFAEALSGTEALVLGGGVLAIGLAASTWIAWRYRDAIAVKVQHRFPKIANKLRGLKS